MGIEITIPIAAIALVALHRLGEFVMQDVLDVDIDRKLDGIEFLAAGKARRMEIGKPAVVDILLDARDPLVVDIDQTKNMRGGRTARIEAAVLGQEADAGDAERMNRRALLRRDLALDPDEAGVAGQTLAQRVDVEAGKNTASASAASSGSRILRGSP